MSGRERKRERGRSRGRECKGVVRVGEIGEERVLQSRATAAHK